MLNQFVKSVWVQTYAGGPNRDISARGVLVSASAAGITVKRKKADPGMFWLWNDIKVLSLDMG
jgi:hypothetical protein